MNNQPPPIPQSAPPTIGVQKQRIPLAAKLALVLVVAFCTFLGFRLVQFGLYLRTHPRDRSPGEVAFREANRLLISSHGQSGFGNNAEAVALAEAFSKKLKSLREEYFTKGKGDKDLFIALTKSDFPAYCLLSSNACVFLVHVPELRRFTSEAKQSLGRLTWETAQETVKMGVHAPPARLVVGVKGELSYDPILIGKFVAAPREMGEGIETQDSGVLSMRRFYPFFEAGPGATGE
jgi:hypothetical protein